MSDGDYAFSLTTFSPSGKLVQIEHALNAVNQQGRPALGIKAKDGVVVAAEKKLLSTLIDEQSLHKVEVISPTIGCCYAGMPADFRVVLAEARRQALNYKLTYGVEIPVGQLVMRVANVMQEYTQSGGVRPFGCALLISGYDGKEPRLYQVDPSGAYFAWKATAIGKEFQNARTFLEKRCKNELELEDAIHTAMLTLKEGFEGTMNEKNIEIGIVRPTGFRVLSPEEVKDYLAEAE